jgi:acetyltransferase-like isoleucine patch superfamily enzyme
MKRLLSNGICAFLTLFKFLTIKAFHFRKFVFHIPSLFQKSSKIVIRENGKIFLGKKVIALSNVELWATEKGNLFIEGSVCINSGTKIVSQESIHIGSGTTIGPGVYIYDHDHNYGKIMPGEPEYITSPIIIGKNVWVGAGAILLKGTSIGNNSIIGAGSLVNCSIPPDSIFIQKKESTIIPISVHKRVNSL